MNKKLPSIAKHCRHIRKLNNYFKGHLPILYISNNIAYRGIYIRAYINRYDKFKKAPFKTHPSLYYSCLSAMGADYDGDQISRSPIYGMISICSTVPADSDC